MKLFNIEAEVSVLGGLLIDPVKMQDVTGIVKPNDFYNPVHEKIFNGMLTIYSRGGLIDPLVLIDELKSQDKFDSEEIMYKLIEDVPTSANLITYAKIVKEKSVLRKIDEMGKKMINMARDGYESSSGILDDVENMVLSIAENSSNEDVVKIKDIMNSEYEKLEELCKNQGEVTGLSSGFRNLDSMTDGFHKSDLVILASRPAMGKTSIALNIALHTSIEDKSNVLIFSLEMSNSQLLQRFLSSRSDVQLAKIKNGSLEIEDWVKLGAVSKDLCESNIKIVDIPSLNVMDIRSMARRAKAEGKLDMIIIDYLQLINGKGGDNRQQEISEISRSLKILARELEVPVIALSQLSRSCEQRANRRPMLSDLRDSGAIEQDADIVIFLYRDEYYNETSEDKGLAEVIISKHRNGATGMIKLRFFGETTKFKDYTTSIY